MAMGIGEQLKGMVRRARDYWSELTDEPGSHKRSTEGKRTEEVHQRYGGVRTQGEEEVDTLPVDRPGRDAPSRDTARAQWDNPAGRRDQQSRQPGGQSDSGQQMHSESQTSRQYTQQGGSGFQKTPDEQMPGQRGASGTGSDRDNARSRQGRRPGQQNH